MKLKELKLINFRNVEKGTYQLNPNFTVFIGINGSGKSTILNALRVACGTFFLGIPETLSRHINDDEIRLQNEGTFLSQQTPVLVQATGWIRQNEYEQEFLQDENLVTWRRQIPEGGRKTTSAINDVGVLRDFGKNKYLQMQEGKEKLDLPVIAFFGTKRLHGETRNRKLPIRKGRLIFKEGYENWLEMKSSSYKYSNWLMTYEGFLKAGREHEGLKELFFKTLRKANPYIKEVDFIQNQLWIRIAMDHYQSDFLPIKYHSDGIITFTEMVAELAYRCLVLNGYKKEDSIVGTTGVVMIDELDMHLHPTWQRHVVRDLKTAFPNLQFVATTHSPFIVQSLDSDELYNLDGISEADYKSLSLNEVATNVMGVESSFSDDNSGQESLSVKYLGLLHNGDRSRDTENLLDDLERQISDPAVRAFLKMKRLKTL